MGFEPTSSSLGKWAMPCFQLRTALIQGMKNANKTRVRFGWCVNGGLLEG